MGLEEDLGGGDHAGLSGQQSVRLVELGRDDIPGRVGEANLDDPAGRDRPDHRHRLAGEVEGPGIDHDADARMANTDQTDEAFVGVDELMGLLGPGLGLRRQGEPEANAIGREQAAERVEPLPVELEEILKGMVVGGGGDRDDGALRLGRLGERQPRREVDEIGLKGRIVTDQRDRQMERPALEAGADHQPAGMLDPERLGLLLEVDDVDVHRVETERQRQFDELAGPSGKGQADGAEITEHREEVSWALAHRARGAG